MKLQTILLLAAQVVSIIAAPNDTSLVSFIYNGSGCPSGTLTSLFNSSSTTSTDSSTLAFTISNFTAQMGSLRSAARRNCQVNLKMKYPSTWQYALKNIKYTGQADLPEGSLAQIGSLDYFSGQTIQHVCVFSPLLSSSFPKKFWY
jgi:Domain of unknown function (DUF4360)